VIDRASLAKRARTLPHSHRPSGSLRLAISASLRFFPAIEKQGGLASEKEVEPITA
jgi:hypothetical protein